MTIDYTPLQRFFYQGQRVTINSGKFNGPATVKKHLQKNVDIVMDNGQAVRCHPSYLTPITNDEGKDTFAPVPVPVYTPAPQPGTVVQVSAKMLAREPKLAGTWIVCGGQGDKSRLFRLNNTDGRYWRIPNSELLRIDDAQIVVR